MNFSFKWRRLSLAFLSICFLVSCSGGTSSSSNSDSELGSTTDSQTSDGTNTLPQSSDYTASQGPSSDSAIRKISVTNVSSFQSAVDSANPGDAIILEDGTYRFNSMTTFSRSGTMEHRIFIKPRNKGQVIIEHCNTVGFKIIGAYWVFEELEIRAVCANSGAENAHAFQITGRADHTLLRNLTVSDFQSHVKLNQEISGGVQAWPNHFWAINSVWKRTYLNSSALTDPKNMLNIDGGRFHQIRGNAFVDLPTNNSLRHHSAIYIKASARDGLVEQNLVVCKKHLVSSNTVRGILSGDQAIGSSGGICDGECRNENMIYRNNIVMNCDGNGNSGGIFVLNESNSNYLHNTLHRVKGNFYDGNSPGPNQAKGNILFRAWNFSSGVSRPLEFLNLIPDTLGMLDLFSNPDEADFSLKTSGFDIRSKVPLETESPFDFCGHARGSMTDIGAIDYSHPKAHECLQHVRDLYQSL